MKKHVVLILILASIVSFSGCEKGYFGLAGKLLSPARDVTGHWEGTMYMCWNNANNTNSGSSPMELDLIADGNTVTGTMTCWGSTGTITGGKISGVKIEFDTYIGSGMAAACIHVYGTFTSTNMEGMKGSNPPPYLTCGSALNDGTGSKGIEWKVYKK